jgi:hypothetical protein
MRVWLGTIIRTASDPVERQVDPMVYYMRSVCSTHAFFVLLYKLEEPRSRKGARSKGLAGRPGTDYARIASCGIFTLYRMALPRWRSHM